MTDTPIEPVDPADPAANEFPDPPGEVDDPTLGVPDGEGPPAGEPDVAGDPDAAELPGEDEGFDQPEGDE